MNKIPKNIFGVLFFIIFFAFTPIIFVHATSLGGHGAVDGDITWGSGSAPGREFIDKTNTLSAGTVKSASVYFSSSGGSNQSIRIKVWRQNGTNLDVVGESGLIDVSNHAAGAVTVVLPNPITAQFGDYPGIFLTTGTSSIDGQTGAYTIRYKTADNTSGSVAENTFTNESDGLLAVDFLKTSSLSSITPSNGASTGNTSVTIIGGNFQTGATVKLTKSGETDITATNVVVVSNTQITADVDLSGASSGYWSVTVTNTDTSSSSLSDGFVVLSDVLYMGIGDSIAEGHPLYHGPEHLGPSGNVLSQIWTHLSAINLLSYYNAGIGGNTAAQVDARIQALLISKNPIRVYLHVGINDIASGVPLNTYLSTLDSILLKVTTAGAELIVDQIIPDHESSGIYNESVKIWNAAIENWAIINNIKLAPTYLEMSSNTGTNDDEIPTAYGGPVHPNVAGYTRMGTLLANASFPQKKRVWGSTFFPAMSYDSIRWFKLSGGATISGDSDTGSIIIPQNAIAVSNVFALPSGSKPITILSNTTSGSVILSYRTSPTNFIRTNSDIDWIPYTNSVTISSDQFIQIKITGTSISDASVDDITLYWTTLPTISLISSVPLNLSSLITWTTNELSSSIVEYGLTNSYGTSTSEINTLPRVLSHSVTIPNLVTCTTYHYRVKSNNSVDNLATGDDNTFTTTGCTGSASVNTETTTSIVTATGGTSTLTSGSTGLTLNIPSGATGADAIYQIKSLDQTAVFSTSGVPTGVSTVGNYAFDLKALTGVGTVVTSFSTPITITLTYQDSDVVGINESSLVIYRYDGNVWTPLTSCAVNTSANTVTCNTSNFSIFSLFGTLASSGGSSGSSLHYGCKDPKALNYEYFSVNNSALCKYTSIQTPTVTPTPSTPIIINRILKLTTPRLWGDDILALQTFLNTKGYNSGTPDGNFGPKTKVAVIAFQKANGLTPDGSVGSNTLKYLNGDQTTSTTSPVTIQPAVTRILKLSIPRMIGDDVLALQTYLNTNRYDVGALDGVLGTKTKTAIIAFQTANGLTPDGLVGTKTLGMMK